MNITSDHTRRSKPKEEPPATSNTGRTMMVAVIIVILVVAVIVLQSGVLSPSSADSADETAAMNSFNAWAEALKAHDGQSAIGYTTLHFLDMGDNASLALIKNISGIFSNPNLVFNPAHIEALDSVSMSPAQKTYSEEVISNITDQSRAVHIDEIVTGYVLITGSMTLSGVSGLPEIDQLVLIKIGSAWYIILGS